MDAYRATLDLTIAARDAEHATELFEAVGMELPEGVFLEAGAVEQMEPGDVIPDSPLARALT